MAKFVFDAEAASSKFMRPELLTHPHIPGDLAGINPRSIMGKEWWDDMRRDAYQSNNGHCHACAAFSGNDPFRPWLEAHECYDFDYRNRLMKFREVAALCHTCHSFIHSGRLWAMYTEGRIPKHKVEYVIHRGMALVRQSSLKPFIYTKMVQYMMEGSTERAAWLRAKYVDRLKVPPKAKADLPWRMVFDGKAYRSIYMGIPWSEPVQEAEQ